jgi:hypothetical protein
VKVATEERTLVIAGLGALGGVLAAVGTTMAWFTIEIGGIPAPGGSATGMEGRDGWTVVAGAVASIVAAAFLVLRRNPMAAKVLFLAAGCVTTIVAIAGILDATSKDHEVEEAFGIPADRVSASVGAGLWFVALGGISELAAGTVSRATTEESEPAPTPAAHP